METRSKPTPFPRVSSWFKPRATRAHLPARHSSIYLCVSDGNGPPIVCNWTLEVGDKTPPTVKCPPDRIIEGVWGVPTPNLTGQVLVEDNCSVASQIKVTQEPPPGTIFGAGVHCIQFTIMDAAGNVTTCRTCIDVRPLVINGLYGSKPTEPVAPASFNLSVTGDLAGTMLVEYFVNGTSIGGGKGAGFQLKWSDVPAGSYEVVAEAFSRGIPTQAGRSRPAYVRISPRQRRPAWADSAGSWPWTGNYTSPWKPWRARNVSWK